jgi:hypothetical protein
LPRAQRDPHRWWVPAAALSLAASLLRHLGQFGSSNVWRQMHRLDRDHGANADRDEP